MSSIQIAINHLVNEKFGKGLVLMSAIVAGVKTLQNKKEDDAITSEHLKIEQFRQSLNDLPQHELMALYEKSLAEEKQRTKQLAINEENARFYNLQSAQADFLFWTKTEFWTIEEAIALSLGRDPRIVTWQAISTHKPVTVFIKKFINRRELALRVSHAKQLNGLITPIDFIKWAQKTQIELPQKLIDEVSKIDAGEINWQEKYLELKAEYDALVLQKSSSKKTESTRQVNNLLRTLASLAIETYRHNIKTERAELAQKIIDDMSKHTKVMSNQSVEDWLSEGAKQIALNPSEK